MGSLYTEYQIRPEALQNIKSSPNKNRPNRNTQAERTHVSNEIVKILSIFLLNPSFSISCLDLTDPTLDSTYLYKLD